MATSNSLGRTLLLGLAAVCAVAGPATPDAVDSAREFLRTAKAEAARVSRCPATADDLGAEVVLRLMKAYRGKADAPQLSRAYLRRSVENVWNEWMRKSRRSHNLSDLTDPDVSSFFGTSAREAHPCQQVRIAEFTGSLSAADRRVLTLMTRDMSEREIAADIGESRRCVRTAIDRIRRQAERFLGQADE